MTTPSPPPPAANPWLGPAMVVAVGAAMIVIGAFVDAAIIVALGLAAVVAGIVWAIMIATRSR